MGICVDVLVFIVRNGVGIAKGDYYPEIVVTGDCLSLISLFVGFNGGGVDDASSGVCVCLVKKKY